MLKYIKKSSLLRNPYFLFLPFLLLYVVLTLMNQTDRLMGDEVRHVSFAKNLLHGFYSPPPPNVDLGVGPGYPIIIAPFIALKVPYLWIRLFNPIFYYLSIVFLFKTLSQIVSTRKTLLVCWFWGCYYIAFSLLYQILTEAFTIFLISLLSYFIVKAFKSENSKATKKYIYLAGLIMGYIALTKIIFGYVILFMLIVSGLLWLLNRKAANYRKGLLIMVVALLTTTPYLIYSYSLTGKVFYWGTQAGNNLYWMSSPATNEYGSWFPDLVSSDSITAQEKNPLITFKSIFIPGTEDSLRSHHQQDFDEINRVDGVARDDAYKKIANNNIKSRPVKFLQNCFSNVGRILFGYPNSYMIQKPGDLIRFIPNGIIAVLSLLCLIPTLINWRKVNYSIRFLLFIALLYLGGSILGSAEIRMFSVIAPIILCWIAFIIEKSVKTKLIFYTEDHDVKKPIRVSQQNDIYQNAAE